MGEGGVGIHLWVDFVVVVIILNKFTLFVLLLEMHVLALRYPCKRIAALTIQTKNRTTYEAYLKNVDFVLQVVCFCFIFSRS